MSKPKDRRNQFARQHKRILAEAAEKDATIERLTGERDREIQAALAPVTAARDEALLQLEQMRIAYKALAAREDEATVHLAHAMGDIRERDVAIETLKAEEPRVLKLIADLEAKHNAELSEMAADIARVKELAARIDERGRKAEASEAAALLNRIVMGKVVPKRNYRV